MIALLSKSLLQEVEGVAYVKPYYSNSQVDKAAERLLPAIRGSAAYKTELAVINQWRSSHLWPLGKVRHTLKNRSLRVDQKAVIVQRLKRLSSIENKLIRLEGTRLSGMQDIGGSRSIVKSVSSVYEILDLYEDARDRTRVDRSVLLTDPRDYIEHPQSTGYRGIHLVIKYQSTGADTKVWNGRKIEIQLRTNLQHSWATALESMSMFLGQQLKANLGDPQWLRFFALASGVLAAREKCNPIPDLPVGDDLYLETFDLWKQLNAQVMLFGCEITGNPEHQDTFGKSVFVLQMDASVGETNVYSFAGEDVVKANDWYNDLELQFADRPDVDVVLVSAEDIRELRTAYPNYWRDTSEFRKVLQKELESRLGIDL